MMDVVDYDKCVFGEDYALECLFCYSKFTPDIEYPRDRFGYPLKFRFDVSISNSLAAKHAVLIGDVCPLCREKMNVIMKRRGLDCDNELWSDYLIFNDFKKTVALKPRPGIKGKENT